MPNKLYEHLTGLTVSNLKCFGESPQGFSKLRPINVIVGRNNSGKSALVDLVQFAISGRHDRFIGRKGNSPVVRLSFNDISWMFEEAALATILKECNIPVDTSTKDVLRQVLSTGQTYRFKCDPNGRTWLTEWGDAVDSLCSQHAYSHKVILKSLEKKKQRALHLRRMQRLSSDRDISTEAPVDDIQDLLIKPDGGGLMSLLEHLINQDHAGYGFVQNDLRAALNEILAPNLHVVRFSPKRHAADNGQLWTLNLDTSDGQHLPISQVGAGIKTVLLVLACLHLSPYLHAVRAHAGRIDLVEMSEWAFAFEEIENNLHQSLQRKLFDYVARFALERGATVFLTTHSPVAIDMFMHRDDSQVIFVDNVDGESTVETLCGFAGVSQVLSDLGHRGSDLLQSNVVIWVEGNSDVLYIQRFLDIASEASIRRGVHYEFATFGGGLEANPLIWSGGDSSSEDEPTQDDQLSLVARLLKICRRSVVIADSDRKTADEEVSVRRRQALKSVDEAGGLAWITAGREIENYIDCRVINDILPLPYDGDYIFGDIASALEGAVSKSRRNKKVKVAREVVKRLGAEHLGVLGLHEELDKVIRYVKDANGIE
jgi:putative ATP-dependent endonuclease of OLD family